MLLPSLADCWHKAFPEDNQPKEDEEEEEGEEEEEEKQEEKEEKEEKEKEEAGVVGPPGLMAGVHALIVDMNRLQQRGLESCFTRQ